MQENSPSKKVLQKLRSMIMFNLVYVCPNFAELDVMDTRFLADEKRIPVINSKLLLYESTY